MLKISNYLPENIKKLIYLSTFQSHTLYCISFWGFAPSTVHATLVRLQKKIVRLVGGANFHNNSNPIFGNLNLIKLTFIIKAKLKCISSTI